MKLFSKDNSPKFSAFLLAAFILTTIACLSLGEVRTSAGIEDETSATSETQLILEGKRLYYTAFGETLYACIYCHANFDEARFTDGYLRPGHSLYNSFYRESYYNGAYRAREGLALERAINTCLVAWLEVEPLSAENQTMRALKAYLKSISPDEDVENVETVKSDAYPERFGDPRKGEELYKSACLLCHREKGSAEALNFEDAFDPKAIFAKIRGLAVETEAEPQTKTKEEAPEEGKDKAGEPNSQGVDEGTVAEGEASEVDISDRTALPKPAKRYGRMPFFAVDRLTEEDVADILAYLKWIWGQGNSEMEVPEEESGTTESGAG